MSGRLIVTLCGALWRKVQLRCIFPYVEGGATYVNEQSPNKTGSRSRRDALTGYRTRDELQRPTSDQLLIVSFNEYKSSHVILVSSIGSHAMGGTIRATLGHATREPRILCELNI
ncbi:uncharacterized protein BO72DRAFT_192366 [Aspergillus fijiensis CBS 313.89]|uniref:Uncharacterized protein n=1 Tax=Aspergillus fijiensis CBS 313.89 TaxID=1448319 RepID=A0A8G1RIR7_9EURO|nr:uncharacterized protein BO72DRAFT_192366 [Aspergillus fijiensis CBS 313.89]RAK74722.1 hypothetical protein BO72DRAFT_192366 [Aspergillus fijiensis CBS 313.89]